MECEADTQLIVAHLNSINVDDRDGRKLRSTSCSKVKKVFSPAPQLSNLAMFLMSMTEGNGMAFAAQPHDFIHSLSLWRNIEELYPPLLRYVQYLQSLYRIRVSEEEVLKTTECCSLP
ncbi:hypothetical protein H6P81_001530 [Aristolochia fimbriata]|uniref:Uncharacterized protein n=1 Tax=Aristolochia fimbriata TaxID=158543 RepID=A0AAV7FB69_ARIFI|nr:hypothetical protein H6P81_001530 [Aristolochia fimbriata]